MGTLYIVGTPIGNLSDVSNRVIDILNSVDYVACEDTRVSINLLRYYGINKKLVSYHKFNEKGKSNSIIEDLKCGMNVALVSDAGCPCISDPGSILVHEAILNDIEVIAIPGPSAVITSLMVSGMDTSSFTFYGFLERENKKIMESLEKIKNDSSNVAIIYESPKRIIKTLEKISEVLGDLNICLCNDLTKKFEKKYYGRVSEVIEMLNNNPNYELGEYVLLIEKKVSDDENKDTFEVGIEGLIIDEMITNNCTMKDAIKLVCEKYHYNKNMVYNASLNVKRLFNK